MTLSILTVTQAEPYSFPFLRSFAELAQVCDAEFVAVADGREAYDTLHSLDKEDTYPEMRIEQVASKGYIESVLDEAVSFCRGQYVLRLDDDEKVSDAMENWLMASQYLRSGIWSFPRMHMWPDVHSMLYMPQLFPDHQTRLSLKELSGGRHHLHAASPFGWGEAAPVAIEHHKFLVKTYEERKKISAKWHTGGMLAFSVPEDVYAEVEVRDAGDGRVPWLPEWTEKVYMAVPK